MESLNWLIISYVRYLNEWNGYYTVHSGMKCAVVRLLCTSSKIQLIENFVLKFLK